MLIKDVLQHKGRNVATVGIDDSTLDALKKLNEKHIGSLIVTAPDRNVAGIISERDIMAHLLESAEGIPVSRIMTPVEKLIIVHEGDTVDYAMSIMTKHRIRHLPVFEDDKLVGLVSIGDVMKAVSSELEFEAKVLEEYITGSQAIISR
jgi:CBS domain-containing protein